MADPTTPPPEKFDIAQPVQANRPAPFEVQSVHPDVAMPQIQFWMCGACPSWNRHNDFPFGQCLRAMYALGQPMYTPAFAGCPLPESEKAKGNKR